jgi:hypothetical protein
MLIKDLDTSRELSSDEQAAVHGGVASNFVMAVMGGSTLLNGGAGVSVGSPVVQANPQMQTITPTATDVNNIANLANVFGSSGTILLQP